jgi:alcohol dehydrogenase class IV
MMLGATLCGMGSDYTGFGISIVLGHATKAHFPISDGFVNAIVLPHTIPFNGEVAKEGIQKIAKALGVVPSENESIQEKVSNELEAIISRLNIPHRLRDMKVPHESFTEIAETAMDDWYLQFVRRPVGVQDLVQIMEHAW